MEKRPVQKPKPDGHIQELLTDVQRLRTQFDNLAVIREDLHGSLDGTSSSSDALG